ncbi:MAG: apolipoprotein N-acyltransferase [Treponema sp. CETP13]|nr:MAG: apolipoprotein N-acyltransferase [Treponema sp. CETP13]
MIVFLQVFCALFSALLTATAIPNEFLTFGSPFIGLFALVPLYICISSAKSFKIAGRLCSLQMGSVHLLTSFWLGNFKDFAVFTLGGSALVYFLWGYFWGQLLYISISYTNKFKLKERAGTIQWSIPIRIFSFAAIWTIYEWYKSYGFLAYPWGTILMSAYKWKLVSQICDITGTWGLSFLFALFNAVIAEGFLILKNNDFSKKYSSYAYVAGFCITLFVLSTLYGVFQFSKTRTPNKTITAVLVQQNADSWTEKPKNTIQNLINLSKKEINVNEAKGIKIDTVIMSESVLPFTLPENFGYYKHTPQKQSLIDFIEEKKIPFIIGCPHTLNYEKRQFCNAANLFDQDFIQKKGDTNTWYGKIHLVPFAEGIPYAEKPWMQALMNSFVGFSSSWAPGTTYTLFHLPLQNNTPQVKSTVAFTTPICFEDAFSDLCRALWKQGSEVFINLTNDSWSQTNSAEYQHFVIASFRAIEMRTTLVRSTNAGYSVVIDPAGRVLDDMPLFTTMAKTMTIPIYKRQLTTYCLLGDWLPLVLFILFSISSLFLIHYFL